jgi:hypothetical protein
MRMTSLKRWRLLYSSIYGVLRVRTPYSEYPDYSLLGVPRSTPSTPYSEYAVPEYGVPRVHTPYGVLGVLTVGSRIIMKLWTPYK